MISLLSTKRFSFWRISMKIKKGWYLSRKGEVVYVRNILHSIVGDTPQVTYTSSGNQRSINPNGFAIDECTPIGDDLVKPITRREAIETLRMHILYAKEICERSMEMLMFLMEGEK